MGFNKLILPKIEKIEEEYYTDPDKYIKRIIKTDALIGRVSSIEWVEKKIKEYYERQNEK